MFRVDKLSPYDKFHCIMGECPENCCEINWNVEVEESTYEKYRACPDERLHKYVSDTLPHIILKRDGKCPFYCADGLCHIHKEYGEGYLCETCRTYPRFVSQYEDLYTFCLAPSCPAVLDLLWDERYTEIQEEIFYESSEEVGRTEVQLSEKLQKKLKLRK